MAEKFIQVELPAKIGDYNVSASQNANTIARAMLVEGSPNNRISKAELSKEGLVVHGFTLPNEVLRALLKVGGWRIQSPEDLGHHL